MKKLLYITNIPAPYRQKRFNTMAEIFPKYGIEFEVLYMAKIEPNREWIIPKESYKYPYTIYKGIHPALAGMYAHFNPGLLLRLLKNDYDIAIVGGMASPTHLLAPFFINSRKVQIMSVESNLYSVARTKGLGAWIKKLLLKKADAYQITGNPQIEYIKFFYDKVIDKPFIKLPNLIDEDIFQHTVDALREKKDNLRNSFGVNEETQMWILPARLIEIKGIIPFLNLLEGVKNIKLYLLGDGDLSNEAELLIKDKNLPVIMAGFLQQDEVVKYYAAADLFVLPSLKDASPLSPIEACAAGLPVLVSSRIGNLQDVVEYNVNGWDYDPLDERIKGKQIVNMISLMSRIELQKIGLNSRKRYLNYFSTISCVESYTSQIVNLISK
jgi:glycosyltransferase involved in cell wall biosynthesis